MSEDLSKQSSGAPFAGAPASPTASVSAGRTSSRPSVANKKRARVAVSRPEPSSPAPLDQEAVIPPVAQGARPAATSAEAADAASATEGSRPSVASSVRVVAGRAFTGTTTSGDDASAGTGASEAGGQARKPRSVARLIGYGVLIVLLLAVLVVTTFSCVRWVFPQDAADIQGTWAMQNAQQAIVITDHEIDLAGSAQYGYTLDTQAKTIDTSFSGKEGRSHYRFSSDRMSVALIEGEKTDWMSTLTQDLSWFWADFTGRLTGNPPSLLGDSAGIVLYRQD